MDTSYGIGNIRIRSEMISDGIVTSRPERAIVSVSTCLNNNLYRLIRDQGWEPLLLVQLNRTSPITITSILDRLAIDPQMKLGLVGQVCVSQIQRVPIYDVSDYANRHYMPSDGFSLHDAHPDGYGYDGSPQSLISLITPEYEPPAFDYSNGLCYIPPPMASMVYDHGVGRYHWGREYQHYEYLFRPTYTPYIGEGGTDTLECWYLLTTACISVRSCFIALGASPSCQMSLLPVWLVLLLPPARKAPQQYPSLAA
eukprot:2870314-Pleurochrysis_carterae.AAC.3